MRILMKRLLFLVLLFLSGQILPSDHPESLKLQHAAYAVPSSSIGVYRWGAPGGPGNVNAYSSWLGVNATVAVDFEQNNSWDDLEGPSWLVSSWASWLKSDSSRRLVLSVPALPGPYDRSGPTTGSGPLGPLSLATGASGAYNAHFQALAQHLSAAGIASQTIIRFGWEFNGNWYTWRTEGNESAYAGYFRQVVTTMRGVSSQLKYMWNPGQGQAFDINAAYPGDQYTDYVGIDIYDSSWASDTYPIPAGASSSETSRRQANAWSANYAGPYGLSDLTSFAKSHGKPVAVPEWGVWNRSDGHGGGDDPLFIQNMYDYITNTQNNVAFESYFDVAAPDGDHQLSPLGRATAFPFAANRFKSLFGDASASSASSQNGYWVARANGDVAAFGSAASLSNSLHLNQPIRSLARTASNNGYWMVASDGGVFAFGDAAFYGSMGGTHLNQPIVGMASTPSGHGYWMVASDGGVFAFGDAAFYGSMGGTHLNQPIVGMASTPSGHGYWMVASDGGVFAFGDAAFYGSMGGTHLNQPIVGMASTPSGHGYWMVASDGGVFAFGDAAFYGSMGGTHLNQPIVGMASTPSGHGYWMVASDGGVFAFGDAAFYGSSARSAASNIVAMTTAG